MPAPQPARLAATPEFAAGGRSARRLPPARRPRPVPLENHAGSTARSRQSRLPEQSAPSLATRRGAGPGRARGRDPLGLGLLRFRLDPSRTLAGGHRAASLGCLAHPPGPPCTWFCGGIDSRFGILPADPAQEDQPMAYTLEQLSADCHRLLAAEPGPEGRNKICALVQKACADPQFERQYMPENGPERTILYEDPGLGFCILGHVYQGAKESQPHVHGPTWAIYGQAFGETIMTEYECLARASADRLGKARPVRDYKLRPGDAYVYNEGDLHSPRRDGATRLIRIEGKNVETIKRYPYQRVTDAPAAAQ